jgi:MFS family permease
MSIDRAETSGIRGTWVSFSHLAIWAYILYGIGVATPYLQTDLRLTDFEAGLHASAMAVGVLVAGVSVDWVGRLIGPGRLRDLAAVVLVGALGMVALAPILPVSLAGALFLGLGGGTLGTDVTIRLGRFGGAETRRLMSQANALAMVTAAISPIAIGLAATWLFSWRVALALPVFALLVLTIVRPREAEARSSVRLPRSPLPGAYWLAWLLIVIVVSIEFSFVYWGSTLVGKRTGISSADATLLASLFIVGMLVGRLAVGSRLGAVRAPRGLLAAGLVVVLAGASLTWISTVPVLSGLGLLLGGLGTACLYPIGLTVALHSAPNAHLEAAARATLASGLAVLLAPSVLGLAADVVGVVAAWPITLGLALSGLLVLAVAPGSAELPPAGELRRQTGRGPR